MRFTEWRSLQTHHALLVPTLSFFLCYLNWVVEDCICQLSFKIERSNSAVGAALHYLRTATKGVSSMYPDYDRLRLEIFC